MTQPTDEELIKSVIATDQVLSKKTMLQIHKLYSDLQQSNIQNAELRSALEEMVAWHGKRASNCDQLEHISAQDPDIRMAMEALALTKKEKS